MFEAGLQNLVAASANRSRTVPGGLTICPPPPRIYLAVLAALAFSKQKTPRPPSSAFGGLTQAGGLRSRESPDRFRRAAGRCVAQGPTVTVRPEGRGERGRRNASSVSAPFQC